MTGLVHIDESFVRGDKISDENWRNFLNDKRSAELLTNNTCCLTLAYNTGSYTVAYIDFFDKKVEERNGNWRGVVEEYLYATSEPIINGLSRGRKYKYIALVSANR